MKRILFITDTYYPDSSATTTIFRRTAEELAKLGCIVHAYPTEISGEHYNYPESYNEVRILTELPDASNYDLVISGAVNFEVNFIAHDLIKDKDVLWFPTSYDPYAYYEHISEEEKLIRIEKEKEIFKDATNIFFLNEFKDDYVGAPFENKIIYFYLPCIRRITPSKSREIVNTDSSQKVANINGLQKTIEFSDEYINCVFLGDFYLGSENTDFIFRLFEKLDTNIRLYTIGNLGDYEDTVNLWKEKLGNRYIQHCRISQEEAHGVMLDCDVLVSMGHDSANMCPSKVIDFMCSGKPILHISKIKNCCAKKYLEKYTNKYCIYQGDDLNSCRIDEVNKFIKDSKAKEVIPFSEIEKLYGEFTMTTLIEKILEAYRDKQGE